ncbi:FAD-binding protein [Ornithinimicrobium pekingense]|uniref:Xylitol oxidase n=1 Tax=Ornithinimicrobium pekingense TaxID=384677 RepID=A0ABQ2FF89_9MICO|nr:FAD-binding protein [Ornithinimicrobium pekingense]GGK79897.1 putative xylitol oxidase [Ornithinimicrobium pekingense]
MSTNWGGNLTYAATGLVEPGSVAELRRLLPTLEAPRALGSRHSFSRVADTPGVHVSTAGLPRSVEVDGDKRVVRLEGAVRYGDLAPVVDGAGWALANLASLPHITVAGAVATGTHGSGDRLGSLATEVSALEVVGWDGQLRRVNAGDADFAGAVVSLGRLGVVTALELRLEPSYEVAQTVVDRVPLDGVLADLDAVTALGDSVSLFTTWRSADVLDMVWVKRRLDRPAGLDPVEAIGGRAADGPRHPVPGVDPAPATEQGGAPGPWWTRLPHFRLDHVPSVGREIQSEYLVPRRHGVAALEALRGMADRLAGPLQVCEVRTVAADELWLSGAYGTDVVGLHFTWHLDPAAVCAVLPELEGRLAPLGARPHWGKVHREAELDAATLYPRWGDWLDLLARWGGQDAQTA